MLIIIVGLLIFYLNKKTVMYICKVHFIRIITRCPSLSIVLEDLYCTVLEDLYCIPYSARFSRRITCFTSKIRLREILEYRIDMLTEHGIYAKIVSAKKF